MKLVHSNEQFNFQISDSPPQRGKQVFDLLPQLSNSCAYTPGLPYRLIDHHNVARYCPEWRLIQQQDFYLSANRHLEDGSRIEQFLPDLPTAFKLEYATSEKDKSKAISLLLDGPAVGYDFMHIGIYGSAYSTQRAWDGWDASAWFKFINLMRIEHPACVFVVIGAAWDVDLGGNLIDMLKAADVPHVDTIGQPLSVVIEILKRLDYFVGFPSGLSILNETLGAKGTFMFYPKALERMMNTWADPARIESGQYKGAQFCEPERAFDWIKNTYKLFEKL